MAISQEVAMPWRETGPMDERARFIDAYRTGGFTMTELCARFGISRRVGYKWLARFDADGKAGLRDRSRAPHHCPHRIDDAVAELLVATRRKRRAWGPEKLLDYLRPRYPGTDWPAVSTSTSTSDAFLTPEVHLQSALVTGVCARNLRAS